MTLAWTLFGLAASDLVNAADMATKAPPAPVAAPAPSWNGFYAGGNIGGGWGSRNVAFTPNDPSAAASLFGNAGGPPSTSLSSSGVLGGVQLGYNWQFSRNGLVGLETDFDWSGMKGSSSSGGIYAGIIPFTNTVDEHIKSFGTVRARLGYLPTDNLLAYVTGGFAYGRVEQTGSYVNNSSLGMLVFPVGGFSFTCAPGATCATGSSNSMATGWTAGTGFEYAFWRNLTLKAEYLYVNLGSKSMSETGLVVAVIGNTPASFNANYNRTSFNIARIGVNYHF